MSLTFKLPFEELMTLLPPLELPYFIKAYFSLTYQKFIRLTFYKLKVLKETSQMW